MLLNATDDEGKKLSYRDIREEVDTFMFEVTKELIGLLFFFVVVVVLDGFVCWGFLFAFFLQTQDSEFAGGDSCLSSGGCFQHDVI